MRSDVVKYIFLGVGIWYVYKLSKEKGSLKGRLGGFSVSSNTLVDAAMPFVSVKNPIVKTIISEGLKGFFSGRVGEDTTDAIDVEYQRL